MNNFAKHFACGKTVLSDEINQITYKSRTAFA